jgi:anion transporter
MARSDNNPPTCFFLVFFLQLPRILPSSHYHFVEIVPTAYFPLRCIYFFVLFPEYYMSYKRLKRIIKKLVVQQKERDEKQLRELAAGGKLTPEQFAQYKQDQLDKAAATGKIHPKSPVMQSFSPMLSSATSSPERGTTATSSSARPRIGLGTRGNSIAGGGITGSPIIQASPLSSGGSSKGSPGLLLSGVDAYAEFFSVLESDVEKVNRFFANKYKELQVKYKQIESDSTLHGRSASSLTLSRSASHGGQLNDVGASTQEKADDDKDDDDDILTSRSKSAGGKFSSSVAAVAAWMISSKKRSEAVAAKEKEKLNASTSSSNVDYGSLESQHQRRQHGTSSHSTESKETDSLLSLSSGPATSDSRKRSGSGGSDHQHQTHTISVSQQKIIEDRLQALLDIYRSSLQLQIYSMINYEGLRKIVKKFDKNIGEEHSDTWVKRLDTESFRDTNELNDLVASIEDLYIKINLKKPNQDIYSSQGILRGVKREVDNPREDENNTHQMSIFYVLLSLVVGMSILLLPILNNEPRAKSCAGLLGMITVLWVSEAVPFFVAALIIPFSVVILGILADASGTPLTADQASKTAFGFMFNDTIMLILGGFSISAAFSKCNFELKLASIIQKAFGNRPKLFLLAFMLLGCFLSCWISNIAAPVLLTSLLLPIVRDFGSSNNYARALLLGLAFSCNVGGMMSPISSPQNAIALGYLEATLPEQNIGFGTWLSISFIFCFVLIIITWGYLVIIFCKPVQGDNNNTDDIVTEIPMIVYEKQPINRTQVLVMIVTISTIILWCTLSQTSTFFGEMGTIAVIPIVIFFGTGILNKTDLQGFSWNLILLIGGGNVLGAAVNSSQLLHIISQALEPYLAGHSAYITTITVLLAVWLVSTYTDDTLLFFTFTLSPLLCISLDVAYPMNVLYEYIHLSIYLSMYMYMMTQPILYVKSRRN